MKKYIKKNIEGAFSLAPKGMQKRMLDRFVYRDIIRQKKAASARVPLFDSVFFEVRTRCNGHCSFCLASVGNDPRSDVSMPKQLFEKVLQELVDLKYKGRVAFHNNSEPLLFKELPEFVSKVKERLPECYIQILTNGRSLTLQRAERLIQAGVDQISVNVYRKKSTDSIPKVLGEIRSKLLEPMFKEGEFEVIGLGTSLSSKSPEFSFVVSPRLEDEELDSRVGTAPNKKVPASVARGFCQYPFTQLIVTADGRVAGCCNDVLFALPMSDVNVSKVTEIWYGDRFSKLREHLLSGNRGAVKTCAKCDFVGVKTPPSGLIPKLVYLGLRGRT